MVLIFLLYFFLIFFWVLFGGYKKKVMVRKEMLDELEELEELEELKKDELNLEDLILEGVDYKKHISVELPNGAVGGAIIRPISSTEFNNASRKYFKTKGSMDLYICEKGLLTKEEKPFPAELLKKLPAGVIVEIAKQIMDISGIKKDEEELKELQKQLLDF